MEQFSYTPPDQMNLFTLVSLLLAGIVAADFLTALILEHQKPDSSRMPRLFRVGAWTTLFLAAFAGTASLVSIEPIAHLREWAATEHLNLSDANANNLLQGRTITKEGTIYILHQPATGSWTLELSSANPTPTP